MNKFLGAAAFVLASAVASVSSAATVAITAGSFSIGGGYDSTAIAPADLVLGDTITGRVNSQVGFGMGEYSFQMVEPKDMSGFSLDLDTGAVNNGMSLSITNAIIPETYTFTITDTLDVSIDEFAGVPRLSIGGLLDVVSSNPDKMGSKGRWLLVTAGTEAGGEYSLFISTEANNPGPGDIPVPAALPLLVGGLAMFGFLRRRA